ncbi:MAG TPA: hypothetical protein VM686_14415 [Polyangiaceae bacterium]|nr:hypothetical protein [Polyangiaceae bacterium]
MRKSSHNSSAAPLLEPDEDRPSERRISVRPPVNEIDDEELKRVVIAFARSQQPSSATRERILSSVLTELGLATPKG